MGIQRSYVEAEAYVEAESLCGNTKNLYRSRRPYAEAEAYVEAEKERENTENLWRSGEVGGRYKEHKKKQRHM